MDIKFDVKGLAEIDKALRELPVKYERQTMMNSLRAAGRIIRDEAKRRVPVRTGNLKKSIAVVTGKRGRVYVTNKQGKGQKNDGWYAHLIEFGTKPHNTAKGGGTTLGQWAGEQGGGIPHPGSPAQPFMRPALDSKAGEAIKAIADAAAKHIAKMARK